MTQYFGTKCTKCTTSLMCCSNWSQVSWPQAFEALTRLYIDQLAYYHGEFPKGTRRYATPDSWILQHGANENCAIRSFSSPNISFTLVKNSSHLFYIPYSFKLTPVRTQNHPTFAPETTKSTLLSKSVSRQQPFGQLGTGAGSRTGTNTADRLIGLKLILKDEVFILFGVIT